MVRKELDELLDKVDEMADKREDFKLMVGQNLLALRTSLNASKKEVSKETGISPSTLKAYETGRSEASAYFLAKLSDYYGVSVDLLLFGDSEKAPEGLFDYDF